jgi:3-oxoacyl-[acyl-carrier-protein] synthase-1
MTAKLYLSRPALVSALGTTLAQQREGLFSGATDGLVPTAGFLADRVIPVGRVIAELPTIPARLRAHDSRNNRLMLAAFAQIADEFDRLRTRIPADRIGIVLGTSTSGMAEGERAIAIHARDGAFPAEFSYRQMEIGDPAVFLARHLGIEGPAYTVSTACTSAGKAIVSARNLIQANLCDAVLTGGVDSLCQLTVNGFAALESISDVRCQPLSVNRRGINIGEGAALFILSSEPSLVSLVGVGESSDAHHISAPEPAGRGAIQAMRAALADGGLQPEDIGYVNLHATATPKNDAMESLAVSSVFKVIPPVSGTKPMTGHALGAAAALEAAFCWLSIADSRGRLPVHVWDGQADPDLPRLPVVSPGQCFDGRRPRYAMSNSFAFGGNNLSLIFGEGHE